LLDLFACVAFVDIWE